MTTPAWKTQLQQASFRGINFFVGDVETVFGRRNIVHEYPMRDTDYAEDLGRKAREYTFNAYVMGDNVFAQAQLLINAIENNSAAGVLVHPSLGIKSVVPLSCRHIFKNQEGGIIYFVLSFAEAGQNIYPSAKMDTQANSQNVATKSFETLGNSFATLFTTTGLLDSLFTRAEATLIGSPYGVGGTVIPAKNSFIGSLETIIAQGSYTTDASEKFAELSALIVDFRTLLSVLLTEPLDLAQAIIAIIQALVAAYPDDPTQQLNALIKLFNTFGAELPPVPLSTLTVPVATPNLIQMALNQQQLIDLVQIACLIEMAAVVSIIEFTSRSDALSIMSKIEQLMSPKMIEVANLAQDQFYQALSNARVAMVLDIKARASSLRDVNYITNNYAIPALVLAYKLYQDATQESDIVARNSVSNPNFLPQGTPLEVLV